ncbi:PAQR family membrane homeostasis protein TrhA [Streptomyces albogriseolus]|uniref:PAQR family membrane homeostasis protein TrhA n=1 Tax=Streptomyces albogriseolus TaxID=1887 RepID=UPI002255CF42|nr:hemolysin III family protein [Streptomyces viridodiastaticus]MCX4564819.1 hemolysin III family protein [Streptomyces viridodiastaticus]
MIFDGPHRSETVRGVVEGEAVTGLSGVSHRGDAGDDSRPGADLAGWAADLVEPVKPRLRGWLHAAMVPASLSAGIVLVCLARTGQAVLGCTVYAVTAWLLFGTSAVYHLGTWGPLGEAVLRRFDHANIFLIIAGTCTPLAVLLSSDRQALLLWIVWTGALAGIAFRVLWVNAPRWLYTPCYLALGWAPVRYLPDFLHTGGAAVVTLIVTGGLLYSAGAVVYAVQRPNPSPRWFGFHEVFHALTVAAFTAHYIAISLAVY